MKDLSAEEAENTRRMINAVFIGALVAGAISLFLSWVNNDPSLQIRASIFLIASTVSLFVFELTIWSLALYKR